MMNDKNNHKLILTVSYCGGGVIVVNVMIVMIVMIAIVMVKEIGEWNASGDANAGQTLARPSADYYCR